MEYPEYIEVDGKEYKIDTDFKIALKCFEIMEDEKIDEYEKVVAILYLLFDFIPPEEQIEKFFEKAKVYLQCGKTDEEQKSNKRDMDFNQDYGYIISSFMSDYKMNLTEEKIHFWFFIDLLEGLTENCSLNRIRDLRNYDLSQEKDEKRKREIAKAKEKVALKQKESIDKNFTTKETENMNKFFDMMNGKE